MILLVLRLCSVTVASQDVVHTRQMLYKYMICENCVPMNNTVGWVVLTRHCAAHLQPLCKPNTYSGLQNCCHAVVAVGIGFRVCCGRMVMHCLVSNILEAMQYCASDLWMCMLDLTK